ncbi:hypothetical protein GCM10010492_50050 [Saccharothrix mutabilis subsp. mutabilis]|uniref:Anti-sigma factor antagonist n=1 Tax=Saccharothrix mutabilis subsp. mutabilis TaxID=66855 RepID=A0ABN0UB57_9PSEU
MVDTIASATVTLHRGVPVVVVSGEVDAHTIESIRDRVFGELDREPRRLVLDLTGVAFLGSDGLQLLVETTVRARRAGTRVVVAAGQRAVLHPLRLTELDRAITVRDSVDDAATAVLLTG